MFSLLQMCGIVRMKMQMTIFLQSVWFRFEALSVSCVPASYCHP